VNSTDLKRVRILYTKVNPMARSKGVTIAVKIPIKWEAMTARSKQRLRQTVGRDTRVIHAFLGVIEQHENELITGRKKDRIDEGKLDQLTVTAIKVKKGYNQRLVVPHDFKERFLRISPNEMTECRQTAVALYTSYLKLRNQKGRKASRPTSANSSRRIPRWVFSQRFRLIERMNTATRWWLDIRNSLDSARDGRMPHDRLIIPLKISPFHLNQIRRGQVKALKIFTDRYRKWWVTFAVRVSIEKSLDKNSQVAILGIDLGIRKAACSTLLTPEKTRETRYFVQREKVKLIEKYDRFVATLQSEMHTRQNNRIPHDKVAEKLRKIRCKRENIAREYDRVLVRWLLDYITELSGRYTLYVAIGRLRNIRMHAKKGNHQGRLFRGMIHSWAFSRITESFKHGLAQLGWKVDESDSRFRVVPEAWTSITCWKCGARGKRLKQNYFKCPSCGHKTNADRNGSINIAARMLMLTKSLHSVRGLGLWTRSLDKAQRARPKAQKKYSRGKSLLSIKEQSSSSGESAAVHFVQLDLTSFSDGTGKSDYDPAVERTVEILSVAGFDGPASRQEKETRSKGEIPSQ
jgi:transposase